MAPTAGAALERVDLAGEDGVHVLAGVAPQAGLVDGDCAALLVLAVEQVGEGLVGKAAAAEEELAGRFEGRRLELVRQIFHARPSRGLLHHRVLQPLRHLPERQARGGERRAHHQEGGEEGCSHPAGLEQEDRE